MTADAAGRAVQALLCSGGARAVLLRVPAPATPGSEAEQLGLSAASFNDVPLAPAVFRKSANRSELLLPPQAVFSQTQSSNTLVALDYLEAAAALVIDEQLFNIERVEPIEVDCAAVCFRLWLREVPPAA